MMRAGERPRHLSSREAIGGEMPRALEHPEQRGESAQLAVPSPNAPIHRPAPKTTASLPGLYPGHTKIKEALPNYWQGKQAGPRGLSESNHSPICFIPT
jgi:hypothetical protein